MSETSEELVTQSEEAFDSLEGLICLMRGQ